VQPAPGQAGQPRGRRSSASAAAVGLAGGALGSSEGDAGHEGVVTRVPAVPAVAAATGASPSAIDLVATTTATALTARSAVPALQLAAPARASPVPVTARGSSILRRPSVASPSAGAALMSPVELALAVATAKVARLQSLDIFVLDNSVRETTVGQMR